MNKKALMLMCVFALSAAMLVGCGKDGAGDTAKDDVKQENVTDNANADEKVTPTFMYFVSENDENFENEEQLFKELKKEYSGKVNFQFANIDEDPEILENFELVNGQTPTLIMLDTSNNISAIEFKCDDKEILKKDIEEALNK